MISEQIETDLLKLVIDDGILVGTYKSETIDLEVAKQVIESRLNFTDGRSFPTIADYRGVKVTTKEARDFLANDHSSQGIVAVGVVIDSIVGKTIMNFWLKFSNPKFPTKMFTDLEDAVKWAEKYKQPEETAKS